MVRRSTTFKCPYCGKPVDGVPFGEQPHVTLVREKGRRSMRVLRYEGKELHRCEDDDS